MRTRQRVPILPFVLLALLATAGCADTGAPDNPVTASTSSPTPEPTQPVGEPELVWSYRHENPLESLAVSPDGERVAVGEYLTTYVHLLADGELVDVFVHDHSAEDLAYSPDGQTLAVGQTAYGVALVATDSGAATQLAGGYNGRVALSTDGSRAATAARSAAIDIWDLATGGHAATLETAAVESNDWVMGLDYHPSGNLLAGTYWTDEGTVLVWDVATREVVHQLTLDRINVNTNDFTFSPDGEVMAAAVNPDFEHRVRLWDVDSGAEIADLPAERNVHSVEFSPDGSLLAVAAQSAPTTIWDVTARAQLYSLEHAFDDAVTDWIVKAAFTPDGGHVAVARRDGSVEVWRLPGAEELVPPEVDMRQPPPIPGDVLFDTNSSELKAAADEVLAELAAEIHAAVPSATLRFVGHTDSRGGADANQRLSLDRAAAVRDWFAGWASENGAAWTFEVAGQGASALKVPDVDAEGNFLPEAGALNRRVEIEIVAG